MYSNFKDKAIGGLILVHSPYTMYTEMAYLERQIRWCVSDAITWSAACSAEYVKEAVQEDQNNNYDKAFELYKIALEYFSTHLKYEKNPRSRAAIQEKVGSLCRAQHVWCTSCFGVTCM